MVYLNGAQRDKLVSMRLNSEQLEDALKKYTEAMEKKNMWFRASRWFSKPYSYADLVAFLLYDYLNNDEKEDEVQAPEEANDAAARAMIKKRQNQTKENLVQDPAQVKNLIDQIKKELG